MQANLSKNNHWIHLIEAFEKVKVLVVGDIMLDKYWFGDSIRISPEAPVPVAKIEHTELRAGGAANVARNIAKLNGKASLLAITGDDSNACDLENILKKDGINTFLIKELYLDTTIKLRVIARNQQLIRIDFESKPHESSIVAMKNQFQAMIRDYDIVVLSDYDKGTLKHVADLIQIAKNAKVPVLVDPKGDDYSKYQHANMLTPNRQELQTVVGKWDNETLLTQKAQQLRRSLHIDTLLLTRSEEGLSLYQDGKIEHQPTVAKEVFDVSGAGDTVIAACALSLGSRLDPQQLMKIANAAAGVVVGKVGTATCNVSELLEILINS